MERLNGKLALVTGASSGMGAEMARQLAEMGADVVLVARREDRLEALAEEITTQRGARAHVIACDLGVAGGAARLLDALDVRDLQPDVLINNAGAGLHAGFADSSWDAVHSQIQLNVTSLVELTHALGARMRARGEGYILNVASIGAYLPVPNFATYAASKAFVRNFTEAVAHELADSGVRVCCLCPGGIATEFFDAARQTLPWYARFALMSPERCARIGLEALFGCRRNIVSGFSNAAGMLALRLLPRRVMVWIGAMAMGRPKALAAAAS